ncbi:hypothetical protein [Flavobacterium sp. BFFFF1]|uniref:hypothetical protein n=1 Tax=Flavobacterium sp. BFFFF1 TaxID=2015557 RepID=UPI0025C01D2D|nr:hypothetical protein [Flavobacterium sp. BFFFF1]
MDTIYTSAEHHEYDDEMGNIILMNSIDSDDDIEDYDFDYDPNEMYYELEGR